MTRDPVVRVLALAYAALWLALAIAPLDRSDWLLENLLVFAFVPLLFATRQRFRFSRSSYAMILAFLSLHAVGAHYTYSLTPFGAWAQEALGLGRNHYDRGVHLAFGLLLTTPLQELVVRGLGARGRVRHVLPVLIAISLSGGYEILEWWAARVVDPALGVAFVGAQGDVWDAQKDMSLALAGALAAVAASAVLRRGARGAAPRARRRVVILGAAGRDFHVFNVVYRDDPSHEVVAFTAAQIPGIEGRRYPAALAGPLYPDGIPIRPERELEALCAHERVDLVVFAYSDVSHAEVMHLASRALAAGADFALLGPARTQLAARIPVIAVAAARTGCGKSQISRWIVARLGERGVRARAIRHPMPYGDLAAQRAQRFASRADLDAAHCSAEEREEYEPYLEAGAVVFAGVDTAAVLARAEAEADVIVWDGGNNDFAFLRPDLLIGVADALRPEQSDTHHPGEAVLRMADVLIVSKADAAEPRAVAALGARLRALNPRARIVRGGSPVRLDDAAAVRGRRVLVVEDGPTTTHGGMSHGAGYAAAVAAGAGVILDPRFAAAPAIAELYARHPQLGPVLPAVGYGPAQLEALRRTIEASGAEVVVSGTPLDLGALLGLGMPVVRARYAFAEIDEPGLGAVLDEFLRARGLPQSR